MRLLITLFLLGFAQLFINIAHAAPRPGVNIVHHKVENNPPRGDDRRKRRTTKTYNTKKVKETPHKVSRLTGVRSIWLNKRDAKPETEAERSLHAISSPDKKHHTERLAHQHGRTKIFENSREKSTKMRLTEIRQRDERLHLTEAKLRDEKLREERAHEDKLRKDRLHEARLREEKLREDRQRLAQKKWRNEHQISYHERKHYGRECRRESHQVATGSNKPIRLSKKQLAEFRKVRAKVMAKLMHQLGKPYLWGGTSPKTGFDCSGLVWFAYKNQVKYSLPRTANEMFHFRDAKPVSRNRLQKGDLVFFHIKGHLGADHVGVYLGNGKFIQSPRTGEDIHISKLADNYWQRHYIGARRIMTPMTVR